MRAQQIAEHVRVLGGVPYKKDRPEARTERGLRLVDTRFSARDFRRVTRKEIEHRLFGRELRDWRQYAERIGRQEDHVFRMATAATRHVILDVMQRI